MIYWIKCAFMGGLKGELAVACQSISKICAGSALIKIVISASAAGVLSLDIPKLRHGDLADRIRPGLRHSWIEYY
jgi:hypothetical protein